MTTGKNFWMAGVAAIAIIASASAANAAAKKVAPPPPPPPMPMAAPEPDPGMTALEARIEALEAEVQNGQMHQAEFENTPPPPTAHVGESGAHKFSLVSADGNFSLAVTGRIHLDAGDYLNYAPATRAAAPGGVQILSGGFNARRARLGVSGKILGDWSYQFIYDGGNTQDSPAAGIQTAQISYNGFKGVIIDLPGYSEPAFTLDTATSSNEIMFMERATPVNLATAFNTGDFRANTGVRVYGDRYWFGAYLTGPAQGDSHTNVHERFGAFQRATVQVLTGPDYSVHLGVGVDELLQAVNTGVGTAATLTISDRPELRIDPTAFLSTGSLGTVASPVDRGLVYNLESAVQYQNLFFQGEYFGYQISRRNLQNANFDGAYGQLAWTLTGEHRSYNTATGAYGAITPDHPFSLHDGTWGAWEIAARYSYADLTDHFNPLAAISAQPNAINGGKQSDITVGLNWYTNSYMRIMLNYVHSDYSKANGTTGISGVPLGSQVGAKIDSVGLRTQIAW